MFRLGNQSDRKVRASTKAGARGLLRRLRTRSFEKISQIKTFLPTLRQSKTRKPFGGLEKKARRCVTRASESEAGHLGPLLSFRSKVGVSHPPYTDRAHHAHDEPAPTPAGR